MLSYWGEYQVLEYLIDNKEWIFSGVGVAAISWFLLRKSSTSSMSQKGGKNSTNIQVGGNYTTSTKDSDSGDK